MIRGFSGCKVERRRDEIIKTRGIDYPVARFRKQQDKHVDIHHLVRDIGDLIVPEYRGGNDDMMRMDYLTGFVHFDEYFITASPNDILNITDCLGDFIEKCEKQSPVKNVTQEVEDKFEDLIPKVGINEELLRGRYKLLVKKPIEVPVGICHGDLTLSNLLFSGSTIAMIDFLDSFVESPICDLVKLRQDTKFGWSNSLVENTDMTKIKVIQSHMDSQVDTIIRKNEHYSQHYPLFEFINLLRILPYVNNEKDKQDYIEKTILQITKKQN